MADKQGRLELGQNLFELIEFSLERHLEDGSVVHGTYGVNVAKVREVVRMPKINKLSSRIKGLEGVFELRGIPIPAINLPMALGDEIAPVTGDKQIIVTEFSRKRAGFIVSSTHRIRRVAWEKVLPPSADAGTCINGMTLIENNEFLFILDLERILIDIENTSKSLIDKFKPPLDYQSAEVARMQSSQVAQGRQDSAIAADYSAAALAGPQSAPAVGSRGRLLVVDDSNLILSSCKKALESVGFAVVPAKDGEAAQKILKRMIDNDPSVPTIDVVVSDVEMPRMDGLTLTKWIKQDRVLPHMPVILHTSLSGVANQEAGISVGANGYVVKNDFRRLVQLLSEIIGEAA